MFFGALVAFAFGVSSIQKLPLRHLTENHNAVNEAITPWSLLSRTASRTVGLNMHQVKATEDLGGFALEFTADELALVDKIYSKVLAEGDFVQVLQESLPSLPSSLVVKLRDPTTTDHSNEAVRIIANSLSQLLAEQLEQAKLTLKQLLDAGEIRKLDSLIGKAVSSGKLNGAFFSVLSANLKDAAPAVQGNLNPLNGQLLPNDDDDASATATRFQILQHIYTRCQEEVEKSIPPGLALLNKLIRQQQESIRNNLYEYYLTPQSNTIKTLDGKEIDLKGQAPPLISLDEFVSAISTTVLQIRTAEHAGASDRASSAGMVEICRQIAKEARVVIAKNFGTDSLELKSFQDGLQPVFRPTSTDSPFIKGTESSQ